MDEHSIAKFFKYNVKTPRQCSIYSFVNNVADNIIIKAHPPCMALLHFVLCGNGVYNDTFNTLEHGVNILIGVDVLRRLLVILRNLLDVSLVLSYS